MTTKERIAGLVESILAEAKAIREDVAGMRTVLAESGDMDRRLRRLVHPEDAPDLTGYTPGGTRSVSTGSPAPDPEETHLHVEEHLPSAWEALREAAKEAMSRARPNPCTNGDTICIPHERVDALRSALARVEGEPPEARDADRAWRVAQTHKESWLKEKARAERAERERDVAVDALDCARSMAAICFNECDEDGTPDDEDMNVEAAIRRLANERDEARKEAADLRERLDRFSEACAVLNVQPNESIVDAAKRIYREFSARGKAITDLRERLDGLRKEAGLLFVACACNEDIMLRQNGDYRWYSPLLAALLAEPAPKEVTK